MSFKTLISILLFYPIALIAYGKRSLNDKAIELGNYIELSIENRNPYFINKAYDYHGLFWEVSDKAVHSEEFNTIISDGFSTAVDVGNIILDQTSENGSYTLISNETSEKQVKLLYRVLSASGLDYHEYTLTEKEGNLLISDIYMFYDGLNINRIAKTYYDFARLGYVHEDPPGKDNTALEDKTKIEKKFLSYFLNGNYYKLIKKWDNLDARLRKDTDLALYALRASSYFNVDKMRSLIAYISSDQNHAYQLSLVVLEGLFAQQEYQLTLTYIDQLDKAIHNDPYLDFFRASVYKAMNDHDRSVWYLNKFIQELPQEESGYLSLLELYLTRKQFTKAIELLDQITETFGIYKSDLLSIVQNYPGFVKSPEYSNWMEE